MDGPSDTLIAGRYRLVERLGSGAMGEVWCAHDERLDRTVAVKQLLPAAGLTDIAARQGNERAMREARHTARLQHPNAVTVHDVVEHDGQPCLVMEYVPARTLAEHGTLPATDVAAIGADIASALAAAHDAGIVHRDVKPDNVLLTDDAGALITDFGISRAVGDGSVTGPGIVVGTPAYLAPEVAAGADASFASDVFSLGATLYTAVEGGPPFGFGDNTILLLQAVAAGDVPPPRSAGPLGPVLLWLLRREPEQRPTMTQAADALRAVAAGQPVVPPLATLHLAAVGQRRRKGMAVAVGAVGLVAVGLVTGVLIGSNGHHATAAGPPARHVGTIPTQAVRPPAADTSCTADYSLVNAWQGGYQAQVTVTNPGSAPVAGWSVTLDLPNGQTITNVWNGQLSHDGTSATVANVSYNATVSADGSTTFGFLGGLTGDSPASPIVHCTVRH